MGTTEMRRLVCENKPHLPVADSALGWFRRDDLF